MKLLLASLLSSVVAANQLVESFADEASMEGNATISTATVELNPGLGYMAVFVAMFFFGSNFLPVKKYDTGDGIFFQWIMCAAIWMLGLLVECIRVAMGNKGIFEPIGCLGGVLWCTGNMLAVPVIQCIGIGMGILIWGGANLIAGWAGGHFGILLQTKVHVGNPGLNVAGALVCVLSLVIFFFVKTETTGDSDNSEGLLDGVEDGETKAEEKETFITRMDPKAKGLFGFFGACLAGLLFGCNFNPVLYMIGPSDCGSLLTDSECATGYQRCNWDGAVCNLNPDDRYTSQDPMDYVFAHFTGIFAASTIYFFIYCAFKKNNPVVIPEIVLPSAASGVAWAIAQLCWFIANQNLSTVVSFPMITTGPGIIASCWGILLYGEIKGMKNLGIFFSAFGVAIIGIILITASAN